MFAKTLSAHAQDALAILGKNYLPPETYMAGGSALALHLGHRFSIDFDFFIRNEFDQKKTALILRKIGNFKVKTIKKDTLLGKFNGVDFSLFQYRYPLLFTTVEFKNINLADPRDIAAMKIAAVIDRGTKKDFIDLYFLSQKGISLDDCLNYYDKKYTVLANNLYSIITSLSYFAEAEESEMPRMIEKISWEEVKRFFEKKAVELGKRYL